MIRQIIKIDEEKCNGCGLCVDACHEGALAMVDGVAKLLRDDYCDGLGDCLPTCPTGAISFEEREADAYDEATVLANMAANKKTGCPGTQAKSIGGEEECLESLDCSCPGSSSKVIEGVSETSVQVKKEGPPSELRQWPIQIKLAPVNAPYFRGANLLIAADCTAYAYGDFHNRFMKNKVTLIGCPKLDAINYADKLTEILRMNDVKSITVVKMQVPCCSGMLKAVTTALKNSGKMIPWQIHTISSDGKILENN